VAAGPAGRLVLGSRSPQRIALLVQAGYVFECDPADIDETLHPIPLKPHEIALWAAGAKARAVAARRPGDVVLAADTVVALGDRVLGKPTDADAAAKMLRLLSGSTHQVITGVAVRHDAINLSVVQHVVSTVQMNDLDPDQIGRYVASGDWRGKAGGYGIQDQDRLAAGGADASGAFVRRLAGCHTNIIGLPMTTVRQMLASAGIEPQK
jgi:septum formation protein